VDVRPRQFLDPGCTRVDDTPHFHYESPNSVHAEPARLGVRVIGTYRYFFTSRPGIKNKK
jgi:hypothetical protein